MRTSRAGQRIERAVQQVGGGVSRAAGRWRAALACLGLALSCAAAARLAAQVAIPVREVADGGVRVDGAILDWSEVRFLAVGEGDDASMRVALAYDAGGLYVAADVRDERVVVGEDAVVLTLALPRARGALAAIEVTLRPGESGRSAGAVLVGAVGRRATAASGARLVEALTPHGYVVEAYVPLRALPGGDRWQEGRGSVRVRDVDLSARPVVESEPTLAPVDAAHLERLPALRPSGGPVEVFEEFLEARGLSGASPAFDLRGDVGGDARPERVSIVGRSIVVTGPGWQDGRGYAYFDLRVASAADVISAELVELTGDAARELLVRVREADGAASREVVRVFGFEGGQVQARFAVEARRDEGAVRTEQEVRVASGRRGAPGTIEARAARAASSAAPPVDDAPVDGVERILVAGGAIASRTWAWDGAGFARRADVPNPRYSSAIPSATPASPFDPAPLVAAFTRERGIPVGRAPSVVLDADVVGDATPERVLVFGRALLVVGAHVRDGRGWLSFELPAAEDADVRDVRAVDVTGDRQAELLVRVSQSLGPVRRELLLVHRIRGDEFSLLLAREVLREQHDRRVESEVRASGGRLEVHPGRSVGWTAESWPFGAAPPEPDVAPLALPWRDRATTYRESNGRLEPR